MPTHTLFKYRSALLAALGIVLLVLGFLLAPLNGSTINAGTIKLVAETATTSVAVGAEFPLQVKITGGANIGGWEADLAFNPRLARVKSVDVAPSATYLQVNSRTAGPLGPLTDNNLGNLALGGYSYGANMDGANGDAILANVTMQALMPGSLSLDLVGGQVATPDAFGINIGSADTIDDAVTISGGAKYIAGGKTSPDYRSVLTLYNSSNAALPLGEVFVKSDGKVVNAVDSIPANGRKTINLDQIGLTADEFSTMLSSSAISQLTAELGTYWKNYQNTTPNPENRLGTGAFAMRASNEIYTTQYFALGFFSEYWDNQLVLFNPDVTQDANVAIQFVQDNGIVRSLNKTVTKGQRLAISMDQEVSAMVGRDYSTRVVSTVPIMAEMRYTYTKRNATGLGTGGFAMRGTPSGYTTQYFALGYNKKDDADAARELWVNFLAIYNYGAQPAAVTITYAKQDGTSFQRQFNIPAGGRISYKVSLDTQMQDIDYSTTVTSNQPVIAEMGYYYDQYNQYVQKADGFAMRGAGVGATTQVFATGYTGPSGSTDEFNWVNYMALSNPSATAATATVTHYNDSGAVLFSYTKTVPARGRISYRVDREPNGTLTGMENKSYATRITSSQPIIAELGIYFKDFGAAPLTGVGGGYALRGDPR